MTPHEFLVLYSEYLGIDSSLAQEFLDDSEFPSPPPCGNHHERQHRDRQGPWCNSCGWSHGTAIKLPFKGKRDLDADSS